MTTTERAAEVLAALTYLRSQCAKDYTFGLERTEALLGALGNPQHRYQSLHIAGTNGKGSTVVTLAALLRHRGNRVGVYLSPELVDFRERITVNERAIPSGDVVQWVEASVAAVRAEGASFFEASTAMALTHFANSRVQVAVVETGLGGRLDSTNVIRPIAAGITSIGLDHQEYLGDTLEQIGIEKAGIFKPGVAAVVGPIDPSALRAIRQSAGARGVSPIVESNLLYPVDAVHLTGTGTEFDLASAHGRWRVKTPLVGAHQPHNVALAIAMLDLAKLLPSGASLGDWVGRALRGVRLAGRFQIVDRTVFDVAHNPASVLELSDTLSRVALDRPLGAVLSILRDKDWRTMLITIASHVDMTWLTLAPSAPQERAWDLEEVSAFAASAGLTVRVRPRMEDALREAHAEAATVLVTGSFRTVGDAMSMLHANPHPV